MNKNHLKEPIEKFDRRKLQECAAYWQDKLQLKDWLIKYTKTDDLDPNDNGYCDFDFVHKCAIVKIRANKADDIMIKQPDELILVHELLHCKYPIYEKDGDYDSKIRADLQHQILEDMAKSLIMVKYNLSLYWFIKEGK